MDGKVSHTLVEHVLELRTRHTPSSFSWPLLNVVCALVHGGSCMLVETLREALRSDAMSHPLHSQCGGLDLCPAGIGSLCLYLVRRYESTSL